MGYNSFYGGRRGASFILSYKFNSYQDMIFNFKKGSSYNIVNYDEYVIIDSNDSHNGEIYRRGYDYNNDMGGAIFVGKISGPTGLPGSAPMISLDTYQNIMQRPEDKNIGSFTVVNESLVPGKYIENNQTQYNDSINWVACSFVEEDGSESYAYVGFTFPYTVIDFKSEHVSAYYQGELITRIDDMTHPFYQEMMLHIPEGKQGDSIRNIRVGLATESIQDYDGKQDDIANQRYIYMCDCYDYSSSEDGIKTTVYLGDFNSIDDIILNPNGTLTISYTHDDDKVFNQKIKWITSTIIDVGATEGAGTQKIKITYNTGEEILLGNPINYIMKTAITDNYNLLFLHSDPEKRAEVIAAGKNATWDGRNDWENMGNIKSYNGILIGLNLKVADIPSVSTVAGAIEYLNTTYPEGLTGLDLKGKIVSITDLFDEVALYAFDYNTQVWFSLGAISSGGGGGGTVVGSEGDPTIVELANELPYQGIWFIMED